jgi:16S rRNA (guanine527-N7)-methyltransferase
LPPLDPDARSVLDAGLAAMSLDLTPEVLAAIDAQMRLLSAWGQHVNLTAIREPTEVARLHVLDSLTAVAPIRARIGTVRSLVDIGSGGGYPGIPLGLALDAGRISLVESVGRKARFLETVAAALGARPDGVDVIEVLPIRAEALAAGDRRGSWDVAAVRAVGTVAECAELGLPLVRIGGLLVCWKRERPAGDDPTAADDSGPGATLAREVDAARPIIGQLGGARPEVLPTSLPDTPSHRLVLVRKERATPARFPRSPASRGPARRAC